MERTFRSGLILLAGVALLAAALAVHLILLETTRWTLGLSALGLILAGWGAFALRNELGALLRRRRGEIVLTTVGAVGVLIALAYLAARFPLRFDLTEAKVYSLSPQSVTMLQRIDKPVHIAFFHDPMMRETVELYELVARQNPRITIELHDPMLNPAQARLRGVQFAGTALLQSEGRTVQVHGNSEADIVNGILRVAQGVTQTVCFLEGHSEANPFSTESHDHLEGAAGHSHGLGLQYVLHEVHGMAKARASLEAMNYAVERLSLLKSGEVPVRCSLLVVAGPKLALLGAEIAALRKFLSGGGKAFLMIDPFVQTGLEPVLREYGIVLDDNLVIDETNHFWADLSAPAVTSYNHHLITRELPLTFFPGARALSPTPERVAGTSVVPLVNSSKNSWAQANRERIEFRKGRDVPGPNTLMAIATRRPVTADSPAAVPFGPQGPAAPQQESVSALSRIAVVGDSDFATNSFFHIMGNGKLFLNTVNYLAARENLVGIEPRTRDLPRVNLTNRQVKGTFFLSVILIPALLAFIGFAVWWKQR
jgi:gliding motility-associatede transport system auxiliary component